MRKSNHQSGSAHVVIIVILLLVIVGLLGFVFWQNFIDKKSTTSTTTTSTTTTATTTPEATLKTYTESSYGISFQYPSDWSVKVTSDAPLNNNDGLASLELTVTDASGKAVANLSTAFQGGQICDNSVNIKLQTSDLTKLTLGGAKVSAVYVAEVYSDSAGVVKLVYGIATASLAPSTNGSTSVTCDDSSSTFSRLPVGGVEINAPYLTVAFYDSTTYSNTEAAQTFLQSSTYTQAAKMIKSLTTTAISQ